MNQLEKLQIKLKATNEEYLPFLQDYWRIKKNKWAFKVHELSKKHKVYELLKKHKVSGKGINEIVMESSEVTFFDPCTKCGGTNHTLFNRDSVLKLRIINREKYFEKFEKFDFDAIPDEEKLKGLCTSCYNVELHDLSKGVRNRFEEKYDRKSLNFLEQVEEHFLDGLKINEEGPFAVITYQKFSSFFSEEVEIEEPAIIQHLLDLDIVSLMKNEGNKVTGPVFTTKEIGDSIGEVKGQIQNKQLQERLSFNNFIIRTKMSVNGTTSFFSSNSPSLPEEPMQTEEGVDLNQVRSVVGSSGNRRQFFKELQDEFINVFPGVAYSRFIDGKALEDTLTHKEYKYFLNASCFALITDENFIPKRIIEYNAKRSNPENYAIKVKISQIVGLPIEDKVWQ